MNEARRRRMATCWLLAKELGLDDDERQELAMMLPGQVGASGPVSWARLSDRDLSRLTKWLRGAVLVDELRKLRPNP